ncbi:MAG: hypothetical protein KIT19_07380 [Phycisphaeraceae bacterium]|nr:hypothetical protein [Phycisphaeraceae bacterium]
MKRAMVCAAMAACVAVRASGQTDLFISEYKFNAAQMSAVRTDGTNARTLFSIPASLWLPIGLDYDVATGRLLWMDSAGSSKIVRASVNGTGLSTVVGVPGFARTISRDAAARIYFATDQTVRRVNADGSGMVTIFTGNQPGYPAGDPFVDATNGHVYVGYYGEILRMDLNGGNIKSLFTGGSTVRSIGLDVANRHLYWLDSNTNSDFLARIDLDGSGFTIIDDASPTFGQSSGFIVLLVDAANNSLYYADDLADVVFRSDLDGSNRSVIFSSVEDRSPSGLALSTGAPVQGINDCDGNGIADDIDIANGEKDCDNNGVPDACQAVDPCAARVVLLDHGSNAASSTGRSLGVPGSAWEVFQPFDVPPGGWRIGRVEMDGFTSVNGSGLGTRVLIHPDNGTGTRADESMVIGQVDVMNFFFNTNLENWVGAPLRVNLDQGRYWVRVVANEPSVYWGSINLGFSGLPSISRGASGTFTAPGSPIALRLIEGVVCASDYDGNGEVDILDFLDFMDDFGACNGEPSPCGSFGEPDLNGDTIVDIVDFLDFIDAFGRGC